MKKILLISNYVFHYRAIIYTHFYDEFKKSGYEFHVLSNQYQEVDCDTRFVKHIKPFSVAGYIKTLREIDPDVVINFLHLKDWLIFPLTIYCRLKGIPMIYWNHGINLSKGTNKALNAVYRTVHWLSDAIIIYTPNEQKYISKKSQKKLFIAYNTLCFDNADKNIVAGKDAVKKKYLIKEDKVILFISRNLPYKRLDLLLESFQEERGVALVIVGPGVVEQQKQLIDKMPHYYYLGARYGKEVDEIYNMGDVYSTPGHIGLGLIHAFFWGKPVVVLNVRHAPEIFYMKDGENGYLAENEQELKEKILYLLRDGDAYTRFSRNALATIENEAHIDRMFEGFRQAVEYCVTRKGLSSSRAD